MRVRLAAVRLGEHVLAAVVSVAVALGLAAAATAAAPRPAAAAPSAAGLPGPLPDQVSCDRLSGAHVVYSSDEIVVYRAAAPGYTGVHDWLCARSHGYATALGVERPGSSFPSHLTFTEFAAAGPWLVVAASSRGGWNPCGPHRGSGCITYHHEIELVRAGDSASASTSSGARVVAVRISAMRRASGSSTAAVVWAQRTRGSQVELRSLVITVTRGASASIGGRVAAGAIAPRSVRLRGLRVSYTEKGRRVTRTLPR